jgi:AMMECR1 domain-containing protein
MSQSLLLEVARRSIVEVIEASRLIDVVSLKQEHAILDEKMATAVTLYIGDEVRSHYCSLHPRDALIDDLIRTAKIAAFELDEYPPITTSEYLHVSVEVSILTPLKELIYGDIEQLSGEITPKDDGVLMSYKQKESYIFPDAWGDKDVKSVLLELADILGIDDISKAVPKVEIFQIHSARDTAILQ